MSHFLTLVLLPADTPDPAERGEQVMERFWIADLADRWDPDDDSDEGRILPGMENAKCDGFIIGGRYSGDILGREPHYVVKDGREYIDPRAEDNICLAGKAASDTAPYAVVTPDGCWHEWTRETAGSWDAIARDLLARHSDCVAVAFDCHC
jgi:hypothetical protein